MTAPAADQGDMVLIEAPYGSDLYRESLALREAVLRRPLGLRLTDEERSDDALRKHFCATLQGTVVGSVSLKPLDRATLQLRQMAVAENRRGEGIGARLLACAEAWARSEGYTQIVLNARIGAEGFYATYGYLARGTPFEENTIPHVRMIKRVGGAERSTRGGIREGNE